MAQNGGSGRLHRTVRPAFDCCKLHAVVAPFVYSLSLLVDLFAFGHFSELNGLFFLEAALTS